jgi:CRP-like cAMP-binding protein
MAETPFESSPLLGRIPADDLHALARAAVRRSFAAGEIMFLRGEPGDGMFAIAQGNVRVFVDGATGGDVVIATRGAGDVLGEMALLDGRPRSASARAVGRVESLYVSCDAFDRWLEEHPAASRAMLAVLAGRLRDATDQVAELALLSVEARVARRLWRVFEAAATNGVPASRASMRVNQGELAAAIGVTRESVNKHLARMKQAGVIDTAAGVVTLVDPEAVRAMGETL